MSRTDRRPRASSVYLLSGLLACASVAWGQQPLELSRAGDQITARGDGFQATWRDENGWQLSELHLSDFEGQFRLDGSRDGTAGVLAFAAVCDGETFLASLGQAEEPELVTVSDSEALLKVRVAPRSRGGRLSPVHIAQTYTVLGEGAIFCDFTLAPRDGIGPVAVDDLQVGMALNTADLKHLRWHWKHTWRGAEDLPREHNLEDRRYLRTMGVTIGRERPYTNQVEMCVESKRGLRGAGEEGMWCEVSDDAGGAKRFVWHLGGPGSIGAESVYSNRCGIALGHQRLRDNAIGQRIAHWQEGNAALMTYPSDSAIEAMAACGVSINVLHLYWYGRPAYNPFDEEDMRRWIASCHRRGIKCIVYATPTDRTGSAGINKEWVQGLGLDGIYFDFGSLHTLSGRTGEILGDEKLDFPGLGGVRLTRHFREAVGPEGIIISHSGGYAPDTFFHLNLNAYLPGEAGPQRAMLTDFRPAAYHSGMAYAAVHPWCEYAEFQTRHGAATYCAIGGFPHILFGRGTHQDNNYHRSVCRSAEFALPYWQMLSVIPMDRDTTLYTATTTDAAVADTEGVYCCVYQRSPELVLLTFANLGGACAPRVTLNTELLDLQGEYRVLKLSGEDMASFRLDEAPHWGAGPVAVGELATDDYVGLLLYKGDLPAYTQQQTARIERLCAAFLDEAAPEAPAGLAAEASTGVVRLAWEPSRDNFHVVEYRLYRGAGGGELAQLVAVEERTRYSDYTAQPGEQVTYAVSAVDVAGNESRLSKAVTVAAPGNEVEPGDFEHIAGHWQSAGDELLQGRERAAATADGDTITFPARRVQHVRPRFTGGRGNHGCAHIVEMEVRDSAGKRIAPVAVTSSGDDLGHPASYAADENTGRDTSAWWSDRNRPLPAWVAFDLGEPTTIASVWLLTYWDGRRWYDYVVETSGDGQEWTPVGGTGASAGPVANARALAGADFADGTVGVTTLEVEAQRAGGGILFRCPDEDNGYSLTLEPRWDGNIVLDKLVDGKLKRLAGAFFPFSIHNPIPHRLSVTCEGDLIKCFCDEVLVLEVRDSSFAKGRAGCIVPSGRQLRFSRFTVDPVDG